MPNTAQLAEAQRVLDAYGQDTDPYGTIRDSISKRVYDDLRPEHERVAHYEQSQLPTFYGALSSGYGMGTGRGDLSPTAALHAATQDVARQSAAAQAARGILDTRGARMEDLIGRTYGAYQHGYGMQQDAYNRLWQQQQHADALAMQREQMALQERLAAANRANTGISGIEELIAAITQGGQGQESARDRLLSPVHRALQRRAGRDTYVSPSVFQSARDMFQRNLPSGYGFEDIDFNREFERYINPSHALDYYRVR